MPIYNYQCQSCGHTFDGLYKYEDDVPCTQCGASTRKLPTAASFKMKGFRAANRYGRDFIDTPGKNASGEETGYSFTSNKGKTIDHNQG